MELALENGARPDCNACSMPRECSYANAKAWEIWSLLDSHGRDLDAMAGNPLPLRLEAVNSECAKCGDPDGIRWRILLIDREIIKYRRDRVKK